MPEIPERLSEVNGADPAPPRQQNRHRLKRLLTRAVQKDPDLDRPVGPRRAIRPVDHHRLPASLAASMYDRQCELREYTSNTRVPCRAQYVPSKTAASASAAIHRREGQPHRDRDDHHERHGDGDADDLPETADHLRVRPVHVRAPAAAQAASSRHRARSPRSRPAAGGGPGRCPGRARTGCARPPCRRCGPRGARRDGAPVAR